MASYFSAGCNKRSACADWHDDDDATDSTDSTDATLAYGSDCNVAIWKPGEQRGVSQLLKGHTDVVTVVRFVRLSEEEGVCLISGSVDKSLRVWRKEEKGGEWVLREVLEGHEGTVNCVAGVDERQEMGIFVSGAADGTLRVWGSGGDDKKIHTLQTITLSPKFIPLALALSILPSSSISTPSLLLAMSGTTPLIHLYASTPPSPFTRVASLSGHEGWITSLSFTSETLPQSNGHSSQDEEADDVISDLLLASASQDKYIRLWRIHPGTALPPRTTALNDPSLTAYMPGKSKSLSNKAHRFSTESGANFSATFEALLVCHEDWINTISWLRPQRNKKANNPKKTLKLLSASADSTLAIWSPDPHTSTWHAETRLGALSAEKGATTATGSAGGFFCAVWGNRGRSVACSGRTGGWRIWNHRGGEEDRWIQGVGVTGHTKSVTGLAWAGEEGESYLLSCSADQTTRLHAQWRRRGVDLPGDEDGDEDEDGASGSNKSSTRRLSSWHEFSRPQIHGYDLSCITSLTQRVFVSGAQEKLLRVFTMPKGVADILEGMCGMRISEIRNQQLLGGDDEARKSEMPNVATIPVLGLSNKAAEDGDVDAEEGTVATTAVKTNETNGSQQSANAIEDDERPRNPQSSIAETHHHHHHHHQPPTEDALSRSTLWPEIEKLYGHGFEISTVAYCLPSPQQNNQNNNNKHKKGILATTCLATGVAHAVIRIFDAETWVQLPEPLVGHRLTVGRVRFQPFEERDENGNPEARRLVSVGRDRMWSIWEEGDSGYKLVEAKESAHTRMIMDVAWVGNDAFVTCGRDKALKLWKKQDDGQGGRYALAKTVKVNEVVVAVDWLGLRLSVGVRVDAGTSKEAGKGMEMEGYLAVGTEKGGLSIYELRRGERGGGESGGEDIEWLEHRFPDKLTPSKSITQLAWRPSSSSSSSSMITEKDGLEPVEDYLLAVASEDCSVRILGLRSLLDGEGDRKT